MSVSSQLQTRRAAASIRRAIGDAAATRDRELRREIGEPPYTQEQYEVFRRRWTQYRVEVAPLHRALDEIGCGLCRTCGAHVQEMDCGLERCQTCGELLLPDEEGAVHV